MGRVFVAAGHVPGDGARGQGLEEGNVAADLTERIVRALRQRGVDAIHVPDELDYKPTVRWINDRWRPGDRAVEIHLNAASNPAAHGTLVAHNGRSRPWASKLVEALLGVGLARWQKGVFHETEIAHMRGWKHLKFCARIPNAALLEVGFITSPTDAAYFRPSKIDEVATVLANALDAAAQSEVAVDPRFFAWVAWKLGLGRYKGHANDPAVRPPAPAKLPPKWWEYLRQILGR